MRIIFHPSTPLQVAQAAGPGVQRLLPADLNAKVREQIEQGLLNPPAAAAAAASSTAAARPPGLPRSGSDRAAGAVPPAAALRPAAQRAQQGPPAAPLPLPEEGADPALYEAEVAAREQRLGPSHPEVAEALSNLAIVHNQVGLPLLCCCWTKGSCPHCMHWRVPLPWPVDLRLPVHGVMWSEQRAHPFLPSASPTPRPPQRGDTALALPLYERALAIWEAAGGPSCPDVAHTLTDIAVIHLEAVRA